MWIVGVEVKQETSAPPPKKNPGSAPVRSHGTKTTRLGIVCSVVGQTGLPSKMVIYVTCGSPLLHVKESKTFWYSGFQSMYFRILNTGFQSLSAELGFRIAWAVFRNSTSKIFRSPDSTGQISGVPHMEQSSCKSCTWFIEELKLRFLCEFQTGWSFK